MKHRVQRAAGMALGLAATITCILGFGFARADAAPLLAPATIAAANDPKPSQKPPQKRRSTKKRPVRVKPTAARVPAAPRWSAPIGASALADAVGNSLSSHTRNGDWGAIIVSLTRGDTLFGQNADAMMQPASTMKMYTSAVALDRFGPDYTFRTPALRDGTVGPDGILAGNLYLRGVGDPSLGSRFWHEQDPMDVLAKQI